MKLKDFISQLDELNYQIQKLINKKEELRALGGFPRSMGASEKVKTSGNNPIQEKIYFEIEEIEEKIFALEKEKQEIYKEISDKLSFLNPTSRFIVEERLVHGKPWVNIKTWQDYSVSHLRRIYAEAIKQIENEGENYEI